MVGPGRLCPNAEGATKSDMPSHSLPSSISEGAIPAEDQSTALHPYQSTRRQLSGYESHTSRRERRLSNAVSRAFISTHRTSPQLVLSWPISPFSAALAEFKLHLCDMHPRLERRTPPFPYLCGMTISSIRSVWTFESAGLAG